MKLSTALKTKSRLTRKFDLIKRKINSSNVTLEANEFSFDLNALQEEYDTLVRLIISIKVAIQIANQPILKKIYTMSELKATAAFLNTLDTREGLHEPSGYSQTEKSTYKAQLSARQVDVEISDIQNNIDRLQDEIDQFNASTTVDFILPDFKEKE